MVIGTTIPYLFLTIIHFWVKIAGGLIFTGVLIFIVQFIVSKGGKRKQEKLENPVAQPPVAVSPRQQQQNIPVSAQEKVVQS